MDASGPLQQSQGGSISSGNTAGSVNVNVGVNGSVQPHQMQQQQQQPYQHHQQQQQQQQQGAPASAPLAANGMTFDLSSFDPLQAHAQQLTESAGLSALDGAAAAAQHGKAGQVNPQSTTAAPPAPLPHPGSNIPIAAAPNVPPGGGAASAPSNTRIVPNLQPYQQQQQQTQQHQQQQQQPPLLPRQAPAAAAATAPAVPNPYLFMQPQMIAAAAAAAAAAAKGIQSMGTNNPSNNHTPPAFMIPNVAGAPGAQQQINFGASSIFPNNAAAAAAANILPMVSHFSQIVAASSAAAAQQQQQQQQAPQQPPAIMNGHVPANNATMNGNNKRPAASMNAPNINNPSNKRQELAPSIVSSSTTSNLSKQGMQLQPPPPQQQPHKQQFMSDYGLADGNQPTLSEAELARMTPAERRRYERNLREQQRSSKITQQINELRSVLSESNVPFKPNKYSILLSVVDYIKQLQSRAIMLDTEHQKLITTIRQTNEMVNTGASPSSGDDSMNGAAGGVNNNNNNATNNNEAASKSNDSDMIFVQGLDYQSLFDQCPAALGIAALDGRILECNPEFQILMGLNREDLLKQSLFNLVKHHQEVFRAMADMLKCAEDAVDMMQANDQSAEAMKNRHWSGPVVSKRDKQLLMNITLTLGTGGHPKFFSCALTSA